MNRQKKIMIGTVIFIVLIIFILGSVTIGLRLPFHQRLLLSGAEVKQQFPIISLKTFLEGKWQQDLEKWLSANLGLRAIFIKLDNQINYSLFDEISSKAGDRIRLGKNKWLYEQGYIDNLNRRDAIAAADLEEQVKSLKKLQTILDAKGIYFLLLIAPSKAAIYPEYIKNKDMILNPSVKQTNYEKILPLLNQYQIRYLDGRQFFMELKKTSPNPLFSGSGTHWNYYSSYLFTVKLISCLENMTNKKMTKIHSKRIVAENDPIGDEADLANLTNLIFKKTLYDRKYYHPETYSPENQQNIFRPKMLFTGDSFLWQIFYYLDKYKVYSERDMYYYYRRYFRYPEHIERPIDPVDKQSSNLSRRILSQDIIIIEMNEKALDMLGTGFVQDSLMALDPDAEELK